ncbi:MAG: 50S ribosomal protein L4 [candidate division Zixibacteria bacterium]|nr:50S ribosomal protein L4 [candidate division Zixibacteria bacterium]
MSVAVIRTDGSQGEMVDLPAVLFGREPNEAVVHSYIVAYLANQRQGTSSTKTRKDVNGGGIKPWRQKGTGRARAGTIRSPLWPGGGTVFGPSPRSYETRLPKKQKRLALLSVLSDKARNDRVKVLADLNLPDGKTKNFAALLGRLGLSDKKVLILHEGQNADLQLASRNIPAIKVSRARLANVYDVLDADMLVITVAGLKDMEEVFG